MVSVFSRLSLELLPLGVQLAGLIKSPSSHNGLWKICTSSIHLVHHNSSYSFSSESQSSSSSSPSSSCPSCASVVSLSPVGDEVAGWLLLLTTATSVVGVGGEDGGMDEDDDIISLSLDSSFEPPPATS